MARYIPHDYSQHAMVVVNYQEQLQTGTFEHAIHYLLENKVDLTCFDNSSENYFVRLFKGHYIKSRD